MTTGSRWIDEETERALHTLTEAGWLFAYDIQTDGWVILDAQGREFNRVSSHAVVRVSHADEGLLFLKHLRAAVEYLQGEVHP